MGKVCVTEEYLQDIADAIREKGVAGTFTPAQMGDAVRQISGGENPVTFKQCFVAGVNDSVNISNASYTAQWTMPYIFFFIAGDNATVPTITTATFSVNGIDKSDLIKDFYRDTTVGFDVKFVSLELQAGDVCVLSMAGNKGSGTSSAIYCMRTTKVINVGGLIDSGNAHQTSTQAYITHSMENTGNYFLFFLARGSSSASFTELSINKNPFDNYGIGDYTSWHSSIGIAHAKIEADDVVKVGGGMWSGYYSAQSYGIISEG